jgi:hypothetical protein
MSSTPFGEAKTEVLPSRRTSYSSAKRWSILPQRDKELTRRIDEEKGRAYPAAVVGGCAGALGLVPAIGPPKCSPRDDGVIGSRVEVKKVYLVVSATSSKGGDNRLWPTQLTDRNPRSPPPQVNPYSGVRSSVEGGGKSIISVVLAEFARFNVSVTQLVTGHAGHCIEYARDTDFTGYDAFCVMGGDGTICEAVTGLALRKDGANMIPLGPIPAGEARAWPSSTRGLACAGALP